MRTTRIEKRSLPDHDGTPIVVRTPQGDEIGVLEFEGVLTVTSPAEFVAAVLQGFGRAKAFGCGLMLIARG